MHRLMRLALLVLFFGLVLGVNGALIARINVAKAHHQSYSVQKIAQPANKSLSESKLRSLSNWQVEEIDTSTPTETEQVTDTLTPSPTVTETPTAPVAETGTETLTPTPTGMEMSTGTLTPTATGAPGTTYTTTPTQTGTRTPTNTITSTWTGTSTSTRTSTSTHTSTSTATSTQTPTTTSTHTSTSTQTVTLTNTRTQTVTRTSTATTTATFTRTPTSTATDTRTPTPTPTFTPTSEPLGVPNGDFESGTGFSADYWRKIVWYGRPSLARVSNVKHAGNYSARIRAATYAIGGWNKGKDLMISITGGETYTISAWIKTFNVNSSPGSGALLVVQYFDGSGMPTDVLALSDPLTGTNDWTEMTVTITAPVEAESIRIALILNGTGTVWFDEVSIIQED